MIVFIVSSPFWSFVRYADTKEEAKLFKKELQDDGFTEVYIKKRNRKRSNRAKCSF